MKIDDHTGWKNLIQVGKFIKQLKKKGDTQRKISKLIEIGTDTLISIHLRKLFNTFPLQLMKSEFLEELVQENQIEIIAQLLRTKTININDQWVSKRTLLHYAVFYSKIEVVDFLLNQDQVDIEAKEGLYGQTPFLVAIQRGSLPVVIALIEKGVNILAQDRDHFTWDRLRRSEEINSYIVERLE